MTPVKQLTLIGGSIYGIKRNRVTWADTNPRAPVSGGIGRGACLRDERGAGAGASLSRRGRWSVGFAVRTNGEKKWAFPPPAEKQGGTVQSEGNRPGERGAG